MTYQKTRSLKGRSRNEKKINKIQFKIEAIVLIESGCLKHELWVGVSVHEITK